MGAASAYWTVAEAVDVEVGLVGAGAIDGEHRSPAAAAGHDPRHEEHEIGEIPFIERQVLDLFVGDDVPFYGAVVRADCRKLSSDGD